MPKLKTCITYKLPHFKICFQKGLLYKNATQHNMQKRKSLKNHHHYTSYRNNKNSSSQKTQCKHQIKKAVDRHIHRTFVNTAADTLYKASLDNNGRVPLMMFNAMLKWLDSNGVVTTRNNLKTLLSKLKKEFMQTIHPSLFVMIPPPFQA